MNVSANEMLDREFLQIRAWLLQAAAALDRIDRADGDATGDQRLALISQALTVLQKDDPDRAEQIQLIFSREYAANWKEEYDMPAAR